MNTKQTISEIGEKALVSEITNLLDVDKKLLKGFGHDSAFLDIKIKNDEVLLLNTDRSGLNLAYTLGIGDAKCVGDFAISHAFSDILVSGGKPISASVALLLPRDLEVNFVKDVMIGAQIAAKKYGAFLASGDTKNNPKFAMVVTAIGKCKKNQIITRHGIKKGDLIAVTGNLGTMMAGYLSIKNNLNIPKEDKKLFYRSLIYQNPPSLRISRMIAKAKVANAGMDNSDGLACSIGTLCEQNKLGAIVYKNKIPIRKESVNVANLLNIKESSLGFASGDWQFIYAVSPNNIKHLLKIAKDNKAKISIIGEFVQNKEILLKDGDSYVKFPEVHNDRFAKKGLIEQIETGGFY